jgi:hypothetical protein
MKLKTIGMMMFCLSSFSMAAHANEVLLKTDQPTKITFRIAHKNQNQQTVLGEVQTIDIDKNVTVPVSLDNFDRAGIMIVSVYDNAHQKERELPPSANQFDKPEQCSMTTDKTKSTGTLEFMLSSHSISCHAEGGVFG